MIRKGDSVGNAVMLEVVNVGSEIRLISVARVFHWVLLGRYL